MLDHHTRLQASWSGEEIEVSFIARGVRTDYGVPRSPTFTEVEDIEIDELKILGIPVDPTTLPLALRDKLHCLADEVEW